MKTPHVDIVQVLNFFYTAMQRGWISGGHTIKIPELPGYKAVSFEEGGFSLLDCYCETPHSLRSAGTTTIWFQDIPVWVMHYQGYYEACAIPTLKHMLQKAYAAKEFHGGRGSVGTVGEFTYINRVYRNDPEHFEGREEIFRQATNTSVGFHEYSGMGLL